MKSIKYFSIISILTIFIFVPIADTSAGGIIQTASGRVGYVNCILFPESGMTITDFPEFTLPPSNPYIYCFTVWSSNAHFFPVKPTVPYSIEAFPTDSPDSRTEHVYEFNPNATCTLVEGTSKTGFRWNCTFLQNTLSIQVRGYGGYTINVTEQEVAEPPIPEIVDPETLAGLQRINQSAAIPYIIYVPTVQRATEQNDLFIDLWHLDENGTGQPLLYISKEELLALPDHPTENLLFASTPDGLVNIYKLTTGEYQVNIGPLAEGKVYTTIFDAIPPTQISNSTWVASQ